jgi:hypothetical protein
MLFGGRCYFRASADAADFRSRADVPFTAASAAHRLAAHLRPGADEGLRLPDRDRHWPSVGGTVVGDNLASAPPDGHTLILTSSAFAGADALYDNLPYDRIKDFAGVAIITMTSVVLVSRRARARRWRVSSRFRKRRIGLRATGRPRNHRRPKGSRRTSRTSPHADQGVQRRGR